MKKFTVTFVAMFFLFVLNVFSQETFTNESAGIQMTVPGGWTYENEGNTFMFYPPEKDFFIVLAVHEAEKVEKLVEELMNELNKSFTDIKLDDPKDDEQNGMKGWSLAGTAKNKDGVEVVIAYGMYATPKDKVLELGAVGTADIINKYGKVIDEISKSIKPIK